MTSSELFMQEYGGRLEEALGRDFFFAGTALREDVLLFMGDTPDMEAITFQATMHGDVSLMRNSLRSLFSSGETCEIVRGIAKNLNMAVRDFLASYYRQEDFSFLLSGTQFALPYTEDQSPQAAPTKVRKALEGFFAPDREFVWANRLKEPCLIVKNRSRHYAFIEKDGAWDVLKMESLRTICENGEMDSYLEGFFCLDEALQEVFETNSMG